MKIYTRTGDDGSTSLFGGGRVSKGHIRLHAYGTVDELNSLLGVVLAVGVSDDDLRSGIQRVQADLFVVGADLATPLEAKTKRDVRVSEAMFDRLEHEIDVWESRLPSLKNFILPGGDMVGALLHQARTVCRRAERWVSTLVEEETINDNVLTYLNRLSDWLFVAARIANQAAGHSEEIWET